MSDLMKTGEQWLADRQQQRVASPVTYARAAASVALDATIGRSEFDVADAAGNLLRIESKDFIVRRDQLILGSVEVEPKPGDRITDELGYVFEVSSPATGIAHFQTSGSHYTRYRIHTKLVTKPPAES